MSGRYIVEREFEHAGYKCVVVFQSLGHRCGYVGIPITHPLYGKGYDECPDISCHGGLTYADGGKNSNILWQVISGGLALIAPIMEMGKI